MASFSDKIKEYSATSSGKIVVVAVPVLVLLLIVAVVGLTVLKSGGPDAEPDADMKLVESTATPAPEATATTEATSTITSETAEPPINLDYEVYETRDPFKQPDASAMPSSTTTAASTGSSNSTSSTAASGAQSNVLALTSVTTQNGVLYANVEYGDDPYVVRAGERVGDSSYKITSVSSDGATFLYGDDTLSLSVGEEVQK